MTAFGFAILLTAAMTGVMYLWARRRVPGTPLTWGEAFVGALFVFAWLVVIYGILPNAWLQWCDGPLRWRSDKVGMPLGPLHNFRGWFGIHIQLLKNGRKYLGFIPVAKDTVWPSGITFFGRGKIAFNAQDARDLGAVVIYALMIGLQVKSVMWYQKRGKASTAARELPTSAYGRPLTRKV